MNLSRSIKRRSDQLKSAISPKKIASNYYGSASQKENENIDLIVDAIATNDNLFNDDGNFSDYFGTQFIRTIDEAEQHASNNQSMLESKSAQNNSCVEFLQYITERDDDELPSGQRLPLEHVESDDVNRSGMNNKQSGADYSVCDVEQFDDLNTAMSLVDDRNDEQNNTSIINAEYSSSQLFLNDVKLYAAAAKEKIKSGDVNCSMVSTSSPINRTKADDHFVSFQSKTTFNEYLQLQRSLRAENEQNLMDDDFDFDCLNYVTQARDRFQITVNECEKTIRNLNESQAKIEDENKQNKGKCMEHNFDFNSSELRDEFNKTYGEAKSESIASAFPNMGPYFGLPLKVKNLIAEFKGIHELYDWQKECLLLPAIEKRNNLIYALPTSGGKTLVSEIIILREIICRRRNCLFILPYVSIVQEKIWALSPFAVQLDFLLEEYAGGKGCLPPRKRRNKRSIYIATIEKGLALFDSLIEASRVNEIGLIVIDELHIVGEGGRGAILETLLTKVQLMNAGIQIIGMSATIGNLNELAKFLNADVYCRDFRPVELTEHIKCGSDILEIKKGESDVTKAFVAVRTVDFKYNDEARKLDPDQITGLVTEVIPDGACLIFCATKKNCECVAQLLSQVLPKKYLEIKKNERRKLLRAIETDTGSSICPILARTIPYGVAYHHSGLTFDERRLLENAFRNDDINVICCTSTLAAGVNLPAKRVIIRSPYVGMEFITLSKYKQMVGRAGRAGFGGTGDSILICAPQDNKKIMSLLCSPMDEVISHMHEDTGKVLKMFFLSAIGLDLATCLKDLQKLVAMTLLAKQAERLGIDMTQLTKDIIKDLLVSKAVSIKQSSQTSHDLTRIENVELFSQDESILNDTQNVRFNASKSTDTLKNNVRLKPSTPLEISKLGRAAFKSGIDLERSEIFANDLIKAQQKLVLIDHLHLLYLITPYDAGEVQVYPDRDIFCAKFNRLTANQLHTAEVIGITEALIARLCSGQKLKSDQDRIVNKFFLTLVLHDLWQMKLPAEVAATYRINRGFVQNFTGSAAINASRMLKFCEEIEQFWCFKELLTNLTQRLSYCCTMDLLPLMQLPCVKLPRAKQLFSAGYRKLEDIASALPIELTDKVEHLHLPVAKQLIAAAKVLLLEKVDSLREEVQDYIDVLKHN